MLIVKHLRLDSSEHLAAQLVNCRHGLWSQVLIRQARQLLEVGLLLSGSDKGAAVAVVEEVLYQSPYAVLLLHSIRVAFLTLKSSFKVLLLSQIVALVVKQAKGEVADNPEEGGKVLRDLIGLAVADHIGLDLQLLGQVDL